MNVLLMFYGLGICDKMQATLYLYDSSGNLVYEGNTYNGEISLCLDSNCVYQLYAISCIGSISICFYVSNCHSKYCFSLLQNRLITFQLTDSFYLNLPIEKGEILLWQKL